jgi:hypothetical protein
MLRTAVNRINAIKMFVNQQFNLFVRRFRVKLAALTICRLKPVDFGIGSTSTLKVVWNQFKFDGISRLHKPGDELEWKDLDTLLNHKYLFKR